MTDHDASRRDALLSAAAAALPFAALLAQTSQASAQPKGANTAATAPPGTSPVRVDTKGLTAKIKFEEVISGPLAEVNGRFKLRITELTLTPGMWVSTTTSAPAFGRLPRAK